MVWFFTPYSFNKKLAEAYDKYASLIDDPEDWICFMDGDMLFFQSEFGNMVQNAIEQQPNAGMFTCYTNRISTQDQLYSDKNFRIDSISFHYELSKQIQLSNCNKLEKIGNKVAGFFFVIKKDTWNKVRDAVLSVNKSNKLLGVDYTISEAVAKLSMPIYRINELYVLHYYRMVEGTIKRGLE